MNGCMDNDMDVQDKCMHKINIISTWLTLEHILWIGPFNSSGEEKQSCSFWSISVLKKKIYKEKFKIENTNNLNWDTIFLE